MNICPSIDYLERAWQDATLGKPAEHPYVEAELPSAVDTTLTDDGRWVMTMFTQYGPPNEEDWKPGDRERYGDTCVEQLTQFAPNLKDAVLEREVLAPPDLERIFGLQGGSIFQGEQGLDQMAFMRPHPEMAQYATPVDGLYLCGAGHPPGRRRHRLLGPQRRPPDPQGPQARPPPLAPGAARPPSRSYPAIPGARRNSIEVQAGRKPSRA